MDWSVQTCRIVTSRKTRLWARFLLSLVVSLPAACSSKARNPETLDARPDVYPNPMAGYCGMNQSVYLDADGDGHGSANASALCENGHFPVGYVASSDDCDDSDPTKFRLYSRDADGDGVGSGTDTICAGTIVPPGYLVESGVPDCDDSNAALSRPYFLDADGDGVPAPNAQTVCGPKDQAPPGAVSSASYPGDCDDNDPTVRNAYYQDMDGDGYAASAEVTMCGSPERGPPPGFGLLAAGLRDCDDTRPDVNPDAIELWSDNVDSDCDGVQSPEQLLCVDGGMCDPTWPPIPVDSTCGSADLVVAAVEAQENCYGVLWKVWVGNQGTQTIQSYVLTIESSVGTMTFAMTDPLPPGAQYPYRIPGRLHPASAPRFPVAQLQGNVRFSVDSAATDCNPANNTMSRIAVPIDCMFTLGTLPGPFPQ